MALVLKDRVKETTTTQGTGAISLLGAVQGYQGFSSIGNGNTTYYCIQSIADWEVGIGTVGAGSLTRDTVLASSNNGSLVGFGSGVKDVFCTYPADKSVSTDSLPVTIASNTTSPNNTIYAVSISPSVSAASSDTVIAAKGFGGLLAQVPNSAASGGNKRGSFAVDWQRSRASATQVASGSFATISGGSSNSAGGLNSVVGGGTLNDATGDYSTSSGGYNNNALANYSNVSGGFTNTVTSTSLYAAIIGGFNNTANSSYSSVLGGSYGSSRGVVGYQASPASNSPIDAVSGVSQSGLLVLGVETTNATPVVARSNTSAASSTNQIILPNNSAFYFRGSVIANVTGGGDTKSWTFDGQIKRGANAAATTLTGSTVTSPYADAGASTWTVALSADTTNGGLAVTVTGQASTTIRWVCKIETTEVTY